MKIVFFELEDWEKEYLQKRIIGHEAEFYNESINKVQSGSVYDADIICVFISSHVTKEIIGKYPNLKMVASMSTGYDHIDLEECNKRGITVCNVPGYGENTVAEHTFGLILNTTRNIHKAYLRTSREDFSYEGLIGTDLKGKTLGVIGTGRIGCNVIKIAKGFDMDVLAFDAHPKEELQKIGFKYVSLDELFSKSDVITIHIPLTKETHHLISEEAMSKMKYGVIIINTARGAIIDTNALIKGLESGRIASAGLDVLEGELLIKEEKEQIHHLSTLPKQQMALLLQDHVLMKMPNVVVTPHLAFYSKEALQRILDTTLQNIFDLIEERGFTNKIG